MNTQILRMTKPLISGIYLSFINNFESSSIKQSLFISGSKISNSKFENVIFCNCTIQSSAINNTTFLNCLFLNCNISFSEIRNCNFISCTIEETLFYLTNSINCNFLSCTFKENEIDNCSFNKNYTFNNNRNFPLEIAAWCHLSLQGWSSPNRAIA